MIEYAVVVPVYNSSASVEALVAAPCDVLDGLESTFEIILVDDGSPRPETWPTLKRLSETSPPVQSIRLSRGFGQQAATLAGMDAASGA